jgi:uncharacterized RDD family membrane protein YckC
MQWSLSSSLRIALAATGLLAGGWMLIDGVHVMVQGKYIGPEKPGPWSAAFVAMGIDPFRMGPLFVALGLSWLICLILTLGRWRWGWYGALVVASGSLWYFPVGTVLSAVYIVLLLKQRRTPGLSVTGG